MAKERLAINRTISRSLYLGSLAFKSNGTKRALGLLIGGKRRSKRLAVKIGILAGDIILLVAVIAFISSYTSSNKIQSAKLTSSTPAVTSVSSSTINPLDQLASATIALTVARLDNLPETTAVSNQADSELALLSEAPVNNSVLSKPQVVATNYASNKDIKTYIVQPGDTITSIAQKFNLTNNSILWSNNLYGNYVTSGTKLLIPPVNGIVYTVKSGDTTASIAQKFNANQSLIIAYNDAEINGIYIGERILIPNGTEATTPYYTYGFAFGVGAIYGFNGYDFGECTWYVATQISVPANWGNADTWYIGARESGWRVSSVPSVGAIADTNAGYLGHVAIVKAISANGQEVFISEMNDWGAPGGGFDKVDTIWESTSTYPFYITRY